MYLTHFGAVVQPEDKIGDFKLWVADYLMLCEKYNPVDEASTKTLEEALRRMTVDKLAGSIGCSEDELLALMSSDIRLSAQGLAIWWKASHDA